MTQNPRHRAQGIHLGNGLHCGWSPGGDELLPAGAWMVSVWGSFVERFVMSDFGCFCVFFFCYVCFLIFSWFWSLEKCARTSTAHDSLVILAVELQSASQPFDHLPVIKDSICCTLLFVFTWQWEIRLWMLFSDFPINQMTMLKPQNVVLPGCFTVFSSAFSTCITATGDLQNCQPVLKLFFLLRKSRPTNSSGWLLSHPYPFLCRTLLQSYSSELPRNPGRMERGSWIKMAAHSPSIHFFRHPFLSFEPYQQWRRSLRLSSSHWKAACGCGLLTIIVVIRRDKPSDPMITGILPRLKHEGLSKESTEEAPDFFPFPSGGVEVAILLHCRAHRGHLAEVGHQRRPVAGAQGSTVHRSTAGVGREGQVGGNPQMISSLGKPKRSPVSLPFRSLKPS